jgi:hypothetical protein
MAVRLNKTDAATVEDFGFVFEAIPEVTSTRTSKWDEVWTKAVALCRSHPRQSLRVRSYNNASTAYKEAKEINNNESRYVTSDEEEGEHAWAAVAVKSEETYIDKKDREQHLYYIYLTFQPEQ